MDEKVDVYAWAMTAWECLTRTTPWADLHNPMQASKEASAIYEC